EVVARLQADAVVERSLKRGRMELLVPVVGAAAPRRADDANTAAVIRGPGDVHVAAAALIAVAHRVRAAGHARPDARQPPAVHDLSDRSHGAVAALQMRQLPHEIALHDVTVGHFPAQQAIRLLLIGTHGVRTVRIVLQANARALAVV